MSKKINKKTEEYIQELLKTIEVVEYTQAVSDFKSDHQAKKLLADYQEAQQTLSVFRQGGFGGAEEQERKVEHLQKKVSENKVIQKLRKTQVELQTLVGKLAEQISLSINFSFSPPARGGCCG